jgi:hypothetical protein
MPYVQGPFVLQEQANVQVHQTNYDLTDYTIQQLEWVDFTIQEWDSFLDDAWLVLSEPSDPFPDVDLNAAMDVLDVYSDPAGLFGVANMITALGIADAGLAASIGFAPAEAWTDPTTPFVPPGPPPVLQIPKIPPGAIDFTVTGTVSTPSDPNAPPVTPGTTSASLTNTTTFGNPNFKVGDEYTILVTGPPGAIVGLSGFVDGSQLPYSEQGKIGSDGTWTLRGRMEPSGVGVWTETIYVDKNAIGSFAFVVVN